MVTEVITKIQGELTSYIFQMTDHVIEKKSSFYNQNPGEIPTQEDARHIIKKYSNRNSLVSGASGLAAMAGPAGLVAIVPEIRELVLNQTRMIYDLGMAHGKREILSRDLILGVLTSAAVTGGIGLLTVHGSKVFVEKASTNVLTKVVQMFSVKTAQSTSKSLLGRYVPAVGAAAIAGWSNYSTRRIGQQAIEIFTKDIEYIDSFIETEISEDTQHNELESTRNQSIENTVEEIELDEIKIQCLINLMLADGQVHPDEQEFIRQIIEQSSLSYDGKMKALNSLENSQKIKIDYSKISKLPEESVTLLIDLITLSKYDGALHASERIYIRQVGKALHICDEDIKELMEVE